MPLIDIKNLNFSYGSNTVFENVNIQIDSNWKLGLVGRNGRGKTTLLKILKGELEYTGAISSSVDFDYFPFETETAPTTLETLRLINPQLKEWEIIKELSLLSVEEETLYRPFDSLSLGEQTKAMLAALFTKGNNFLLIDEPTNHLDVLGRKIVNDYLKTKKGFIIVSHDRVFLDSCVDYILSINRNNIELQKGDFSSYFENKQMQDNFETLQNRKLKKEIKKLEQSARQSAAWSNKIEGSKIGAHVYDRGFVGHKAAKMMKRSKNIEKRKEKAAEDKSALMKNIDNYEDITLKYVPYHKSNLVSAEGLSAFYGDKAVFKDLSFNINVGDRVCIRGKNGAGKSSLIKLLAGGGGVDYTGKLRIPPGLKISYLTQVTSYLKGPLKEYIMDQNLDEAFFKTILRKLDFGREQFDFNLESYSEGQRKKVLVAKSICEGANLFIWDEPLNYIDIFSKIQIEDMILKVNPTMVFVEHDEAFVNKIATGFIDLKI
ncbi:MAG: ABC-F type ribosomal protection protein [Clostridiales bacterium]|jgi:lincosamide and streptogramin A transport system ATP-binding/permease protein|nr:ABC-F type ribosomal protection protein [Clostridiales bacterium]